MEDCRQYIEGCLLNGERISYVHEKNSREAILLQLKEISELSGMSDLQLLREEAAKEMIWVLLKNEKIERGMYCHNKPDAELVVCAPAALMAVILGEYELAKRICEIEERNYENDTAFEVQQDYNGPHLKGGKYRFCEACVLSCDMEWEETVYFMGKGMFDISLYEEQGNGFFSDVCMHGSKMQMWEYIYKMMKRLSQQLELYETFQALIFLLMWFALLREIDKDNVNFWNCIYGLFSEEEQWILITEFIHGRWFQDIRNSTIVRRSRILACTEEHFKHMDYLPMDGHIRKYAEYLVRQISEVGDAQARECCRDYFLTVKQFAGKQEAEWKELMLALLRSKDLPLIELGFQNCLLNKEWIAEYIDYFMGKKDYSWILSYLIQKSWSIKEIENGNIQ